MELEISCHWLGQFLIVGLEFRWNLDKFWRDLGPFSSQESNYELMLS